MQCSYCKLDNYVLFLVEFIVLDQLSFSLYSNHCVLVVRCHSVFPSNFAALHSLMFCTYSIQYYDRENFVLKCLYLEIFFYIDTTDLDGLINDYTLIQKYGYSLRYKINS